MASLSLDEARRFLLNLLPPGADKLYDLTAAGDVYRLFDGLAVTVKQFGFDLLETLRAEIFPSSCVQKLPDWETALGLTPSYAASNGTASQRQTAILARLREFGAFTPYLVRSIVAPLLGYADFTQLQVIEATRAALTAAHTYVDTPPGSLGAIAANGSLTRPVYVPDGGNVSRAGAQLTVWLTHPAIQGLSVRLTAPDGRAKTWTRIASGPGVNQPFLLYGAELAGTACGVQWVLTLLDSSGNPGTLVRWQLFVEGVGSSLPGPVPPGGAGLGGDIFDWGVYADPTLVGAAQPPDLAGVLRAIARIKHAHTTGHIIRAWAPAPETASTIPDQFIPG